MFSGLEEDTAPLPLDIAVAQMLPVNGGKLPSIGLHTYADVPTTLHAEIRICSRTGSYTPDTSIATFEFALQAGRNCVQLMPDVIIEQAQYIFVVLHKNPMVKISRSHKRITGILSVFNTVNPAVSNYGKQQAPEGIGIDTFEFWCAQRRPAGQNIALQLGSPLQVFGPANISNGIARPTTQSNAWVSDGDDPDPTITIRWESRKRIKRIIFSFDTDFDHPMESVLMSHPENVMPFCVRNYSIFDDNGNKVYERAGNYQTRNEIILSTPLLTSSLTIKTTHPSIHTPAAIFEIRCFEQANV